MKRTDSAAPRWSRLELLCLVILISAATWLRLEGLGRWSLWLDETLSWMDVHTLMSGGGEELSAPLTVSLLLQWLSISVFGASDLALRLPAALLGLASLPLLHLLGRRALGPHVSLTALALLVTSPWHLFWCQSARAYSFVVLLWTAAATLAMLPTAHRRWRLVLAGALLLLGGLERRYLFLHAGCLLPFLAVRWWRRDPRLRRWMVLAAVVGAIAIIGYELLSSALGQFGLLEEFDSFRGRGSRRSIPALMRDIIRRVGWPALLLTLAGSIALLIRWRKGPVGLLLIGGIPFATKLALTPFAKVFERYAFHGLPALFAVAAVGFWSLMGRARSGQRPWLRATAVLLAVGLMGGALSYNAVEVRTYYRGHGDREEWRFAVEHVLREGGEERPELWFRWPIIARRYSGERIELHDLDEVPLPEDAGAQGAPRWVLLGNKPHDRPFHRAVRGRGSAVSYSGQARATLYRLQPTR